MNSRTRDDLVDLLNKLMPVFDPFTDRVQYEGAVAELRTACNTLRESLQHDETIIEPR